MDASTTQCWSLGAAVSFLVSVSHRAVARTSVVMVRMAECGCSRRKAAECQVSGVLV